MSDNNEKKNMFKDYIEKAMDVVVPMADFAKEKGEQILDFADDAKDKITIVAEGAVETGKKISEDLKIMKQNNDRKILRPVFVEDIEENTFDFPRMINLCEEDDKHKNNIVCLDSIGFRSSPNDVELLNIYDKDFDYYGINLEPKRDIGVYYLNPCIPNTYIEIEEYFKYLQKEKATELLNIARDLGAKYVKIEIYEKEISADSLKAKAQGKVGKNKVDVELDKQSKQMKSIDVFADEELEGHDDPTRPVLRYFKNDKTIKDIIEQRFDKKNRLKKHTFKIESSSSSSMKEKEAVNIDGALKSMKCSVKESMAIGAERANSSYFAYTIEF